MRGTLSVWISLCVATGSAPADEPTAPKAAANEALAILKKAEAALKNTKRVRYRAKYGSTGFIAAWVPRVEGTVVLGQRSRWDLDRFRCEVTLTPPRSGKMLKFTAGCDGEVFFLLDPKTRTAHEDMDPVVLGSHGRDIQRVLMREFAAPEIWGDDLKPETLTLVGTETVGGVECYEIHIKSEHPPETVWFIARKDSQPRRVRRIYPSRRDPEGEKGTTELTVTDLVVDPKLPHDFFKLVVPTGFTKTDEFAP